MISIWAVFILLYLHLVGDFILQSDRMAINKSKSWKVLAEHVGVYSLCFVWAGVTFALLTFLLHFLTDAVTSRITSKLWFFQPTGVAYNAGGKRYQLWVPEGGSRHWFFVMIGVDQFIHFVSLIGLWHLIK